MGRSARDFAGAARRRNELQPRLPRARSRTAGRRRRRRDDGGDQRGREDQTREDADRVHGGGRPAPGAIRGLEHLPTSTGDRAPGRHPHPPHSRHPLRVAVHHPGHSPPTSRPGSRLLRGHWAGERQPSRSFGRDQGLTRSAPKSVGLTNPVPQHQGKASLGPREPVGHPLEGTNTLKLSMAM